MLGGFNTNNGDTLALVSSHHTHSRYFTFQGYTQAHSVRASKFVVSCVVSRRRRVGEHTPMSPTPPFDASDETHQSKPILGVKFPAAADSHLRPLFFWCRPHRCLRPRPTAGLPIRHARLPRSRRRLMLFVTLRRGLAGKQTTYVQTLKSLGLHKVRQEVAVANNEAVRGQIDKVKHLVSVETSAQRDTRLAELAVKLAPKEPLVVHH